ncbi:MAG TPA: PQQ-dependent sugar dehydrogenase [Solirubrobacteraceae bacterium]|nr:PQQ-dependent sugar dehydrogenase [Solirubrobacteraceae bacterium]
MTRHARRAARAAVLIAAVVVAGSPVARADVTSSGNLRLVRVPDDTTTFPGALDVAAPPGDPSRLFVVERSGLIELIEDGQATPSPFLDLQGSVNSWAGVSGTPSENGLASIAFAPDYAQSGRFFAFYTSSNPADCDTTNTNSCDDRLVEFRRSPGDPDVADPTPVRTLLVVTHRDTAVHHSGQLQFGYDGLLYVGTGDGGKPGDGNHRAQDRGSLSGKVLRLNVADPSPTPQIWALGLRNPYRFSFDAGTGDLALGDVGENTREEIDVRPFGAGPGANFGWSVCEGEMLFVPGPAGFTVDPCPGSPVADYVAPALTYPHSGAAFCSGAVIGGRVARDPTVPELLGRYLYGDFCQGFIRSATLTPTTAPVDTGLSVDQLTAFGQDARCRLYATSLVGFVYRLDSTSATGSPSCPPTPQLPPAPVGSADGGAPVPPGGAQSRGAVRRTPAPAITHLAMTRRRFAVASRPTAIRAATPRGSAFVYRLSRSATVTIVVDQLLAGRRVGRRCLAPARRRRGRACTRSRRRGTLIRSAGAGVARTAFSGRIGRRALPPGRYRATLRARDAAGAVSSPRTTEFAILAG